MAKLKAEEETRRRAEAAHGRTADELAPLWEGAECSRDELLRLCLVVQWNGFASGLFLHQSNMLGCADDKGCITNRAKKVATIGHDAPAAQRERARAEPTLTSRSRAREPTRNENIKDKRPGGELTTDVTCVGGEGEPFFENRKAHELSSVPPRARQT